MPPFLFLLSYAVALCCLCCSHRHAATCSCNGAVAASLRRNAFLVGGLRVPGLRYTCGPPPTTATPPHRHRIISAQEHEEPRPDTPPQRGTRPRKVRMPLRRTTPPESPLVSGPEAAEYRTRGVPDRRGSPSPLRDHTGSIALHL